MHFTFGLVELALFELPQEFGATLGKVQTDFLNSQADTVGLLNLSHEYLKQLASSVPGAHVKKNPRPTGWYVAKTHKTRIG